MNINKLAVATSLTSAIALGAFVESADAQVLRRRLGHTYSRTSVNETEIEAQFNLFDTTEDGKPILDQDPSAQIGLFVGAIEDYTLVSGAVCSNSSFILPGTDEFSEIEAVCKDRSNSSKVNADSTYLYDDSGYPIFLESYPLTPDPMWTPINANLSVQLYERGKDPLFLDSQEPTIAYSITNPETDEILFTARLFSTGTDGETVGYSEIVNFNSEEAVNSLSYILENDLLAKASPLEDDGDGSFTNDTASVLVQNKFEQDVSTTPVPEPVSMLGTLAALGVGALLKLKKQH